ncbi:hypothetical protein [Bradyrhizobium sp. STM 3561]|uniref:hypothetical protein n=1 Tax=Bradyrhizobium sp. STM 3561 TaxID=578923 RepID=UPI00388CF1F2
MEVMHPKASYRILRFAPLHAFLVQDDFANLGLFQNAFVALAGDQYNLRITRKRHQRVFCSELIGEIFSACGFTTLGSSHKLLPTEIDRIARRDPINWLDITAEQNEKLKSLTAYKLFHDSRIHPGASAGLIKAKRHVLRERLKHNAAMGNAKLVAGLKHFGTTNARDYSDPFAGYNLVPLTPEERKRRIRPDGIEFWFRAQVMLMTADQPVNYFFDTCHPPFTGPSEAEADDSDDG